MNKSEIATLLHYNRWANETLLDAAAQLKQDAFTKDLGSSYPSVRNTLTHVMWGEWLWLQRWQGLSPTNVFAPAAYPSVEQLRSAWRPIQDDQLRLVNGLAEEALEKVIAYRNLLGEVWKYPLRQMIQHVVNHSTYHRGQVVTLLRQLGTVPPPTDLLVFIDKCSADPAV
jgi:uncharacterized damage-inducible protein DinB